MLGKMQDLIGIGRKTRDKRYKGVATIGITFTNDNCKCDNCMYLLHKEKRKDEEGNEHIKYYCMISSCVKKGIKVYGKKDKAVS